MTLTHVVGLCSTTMEVAIGGVATKKDLVWCWWYLEENLLESLDWNTLLSLATMGHCHC